MKTPSILLLALLFAFAAHADTLLKVPELERVGVKAKSGKDYIEFTNSNPDKQVKISFKIYWVTRGTRPLKFTSKGFQRIELAPKEVKKFSAPPPEGYMLDGGPRIEVSTASRK